MVDFVHEQPISVAKLAARFEVNPITVRRWFARGLAFGKVGGLIFTTLEAVNRFQNGDDSQPQVQAIVVDRETLAAIKSLRKQGIHFGPEAGTDGDKKTAVRR